MSEAAVRAVIFSDALGRRRDPSMDLVTQVPICECYSEQSS